MIDKTIQDYLTSKIVIGNNRSVKIILHKPQKLSQDAVELDKIFNELLEFDGDWPYVGFNFEKNKWILTEASLVISADSKSNKVNYILYKQPTISCYAFTRLVEACGWKIPIECWRPA
jgi:hypothetical protein